MDQYSKKESEDALIIVTSTILKCEKAQLKFQEGTSQHTLLKNRIKALYISKSFILKEDIADKYSVVELTEALHPVASIIGKCEKAQLKFEEGTAYYIRFMKIINAMKLSKALITNEISKRG